MGNSRKKQRKADKAAEAYHLDRVGGHANADQSESLNSMVRQTKVVITTVGPYLKYGEKLVQLVLRTRLIIAT